MTYSDRKYPDKIVVNRVDKHVDIFKKALTGFVQSNVEFQDKYW